jgi:Type-F conjugative transfer system pilin assembly protein
MRSPFRLGQGLWLLAIGLIPLGSGTEASVTHYVSLSMPASVIAAHQTPGSTLVLRGFPKGAHAMDPFMPLIPSLRTIPPDLRPTIVINPTAFEMHHIDKVPVTFRDGAWDRGSAHYPVIERDPRLALRAALQRITPEQLRSELMRSSDERSSPQIPIATEVQRHSLRPRFQLKDPLIDQEAHPILQGDTMASPPLGLWGNRSLLVIHPNDPKQLNVAREELERDPSLVLLGVGNQPGSVSMGKGDSASRGMLGMPSNWLHALGIKALPARILMTDDRIEVTSWPP